MEKDNQSEIRHLLHTIEAEYRAAHCGLQGLASVAQHRVRTRRTEQIGRLHQQLQHIVGEDNAIQLVAQALDRL